MKSLKPHHKAWRYKNIILTVLSIVLVVVLSRNPVFDSIVTQIGHIKYFGPFLGGALFVCTFTISFGAIILFDIAKTVSPIEISIFAALGAVFTNYVVFHFVKNNLTEEIEELYEDISGHHLKIVFHSKFFGWMLPVIGAILIISPLPDEFGVSLLGIARMNPLQFLVLSFVLNAIGIIIAVTVPNLRIG